MIAIIVHWLLFIIVIAGVAGVIGVLIVIVEKKVTKAYRENCWDVISVGMAVIGLAVAVYFGDWIKALVKLNLVALLLLVQAVYVGIRVYVKGYEDEEEIASYLSKILKKEAFDQKGLIYGMGHAVYSISDPRERVFKGFVEQLARDKGREKDMTLYNNIEKIAPKLIAKQRQMFKEVSPNIDFYSGFVYDMLNIPRELYTPLFAIARIAGWSAHRLEELITTDKIIRPAYKSLVSKKEYIEREER